MGVITSNKMNQKSQGMNYSWFWPMAFSKKRSKSRSVSRGI